MNEKNDAEPRKEHCFECRHRHLCPLHHEMFWAQDRRYFDRNLQPDVVNQMCEATAARCIHWLAPKDKQP